MTDTKGQKVIPARSNSGRFPVSDNMRSPTRKGSLDPTKDKKEYFKHNVQDPHDQEEDFDPNMYYYHRQEKEDFPVQPAFVGVPPQHSLNTNLLVQNGPPAQSSRLPVSVAPQINSSNGPQVSRAFNAPPAQAPRVQPISAPQPNTGVRPMGIPIANPASRVNGIPTPNGMGVSAISSGISMPQMRMSGSMVPGSSGVNMGMVSHSGFSPTGMVSKLPLKADAKAMPPNLSSLSTSPLSFSSSPISNNPADMNGTMMDSLTSFDMSDFPALGTRVTPPAKPTPEFNPEDFPALPGFKGSTEVDALNKEQQNVQNDQMFGMAAYQALSNSGAYGGATQKANTLMSSSGFLQPTQNLRNSSSSLSSSYDGIQVSPSPSLQPQQPSQQRVLQSPQKIQPPQQPLSQSQQQQQQQQQQPLSQSQQLQQQQQQQQPLSQSQQQFLPDRFGLLGLLSVIRMTDPDLNTLALGTDLTTLGLNLNSPDCLYATFASPFADSPSRREPEFYLPLCYYTQPPMQSPTQKMGMFNEETLFYIFYSMPRDSLQVQAAGELYARDWRYHKEHKLWFTRAHGADHIVKTASYERGSFYYFDPNAWEKMRKDNFVLCYDQLEAKAS